MTGKFIVVTGGTKGIGKAILEKFLDNGFNVATCARSQASIESLVTVLGKRNPHAKVFAFCHDLSREKEAAAFTQNIRDLNLQVDALVNNAGIFMPGRLIDEAPGAMENMIAQNLFSAYYVTRGLVQDMIRSKKGYIFNMCSVASLIAHSNGGSYTVSKFGLLGFSKSLREELKGSGIRVTAVLPGATLTASWEGTEIPQSRFMKAEDVAEAVFSAYSLSENSVVEEIIIRPQLGDI